MRGISPRFGRRHMTARAWKLICSGEFVERILWATTFLAITMACPRLALAQLSTTATISGTVTDTSGAAVPDATVTVTNQNTNVGTTRQSNAQGEFVFPGLSVAPYRVSVTKQGFATYTESGLMLHPSITATVDVKLQPGTVKTQVVVNAAAVQVDTTTPAISSDVTADQVKTLPLNGRNYQALAAVMPGVQNLSAGSALGTGGRATSNVISVNGLQQSTSFYVLDGIWDENTGNMNQTTILPNPDSLEEVRVLQNDYSVRYSLMGASVVLLQTRSGTNTFHGNAWEYLRNDDLNARNYFARTIPEYKQNIYGYNLGGPLFIPHFYNRNRQKTFFFLSEQWVRLNQGATLVGITPPALERQGIFSTKIVDPATGNPFPQNSAGQYVIPTSALNPNSVAFANALYPLPNYASGNDNYLNDTPQVTNQRDDEIKIDHTISPKFRLTGEYLDERQTYRQSSLNGAQSGEIFNTNYESDQTENQMGQLSLTSLLTNNIVNTTSVSTNIYDLNLNLEGADYVNQVPGFAENLPYSGYLSNRLPLVSISGGIGPEGMPASRPLNHAADLDDSVNDDFSWLHGRHFLQGGINIVFNTKRQNPVSATNGQWTFTGNFTGNAFADFMLGDASTFTQTSNQRRVAIHAMIVSPYFEDRVQLTHNLTLTAGIRFSHMPLPYPAPDSETIFDPAAYNSTDAPAITPTGVITGGNYNPLNGLLTNSENGVPVNFSSVHNWYVGPSIGFAWNVFGDGKTSLRGGYGLAYTRIFTNQDCSFSCANNPPAITSANLVNPVFPNAATSGVAAAKTIQSLSSADLNIQASQIQTYSLGLQHQFGQNWIASVTGASSQLRHMVGTWNYNQPAPYGNYDFNPAINAGTTSPYYYAPYIGYAAISTLATRLGQNWDALEASLKHPMGRNLFLTAAYTWSHNLTNYVGGSYNVVDPYAPSRYYGNTAGLNFPQSASVTAIWTLPWLRASRGVEGSLLGGWHYSDITTIRSGVSLDPGLSIAHQGLAVRPNLVSQKIGGPKTVAQWFNTSAFAAPAAGYYGDSSIGLIRGPGLVDFDMALYKDFHIWRSNLIQFRGEAFNTFNHTNFSGVSTTYGASNFGQVTSALDPRILEVALRYQF